MRAQSRQQPKFQALLAERAQFMRHNGTDTERALWFHLSANRLLALVIRCWRQVEVQYLIGE